MIAPPFLPVPPPGYGGTERVVALLVDRLVALGHDVTLFAAADSSTRARLVTPLPIAPALGDPSSVSGELAHLSVAYRRAGDFDVIHDHTWMGPAIGAALPGLSAVVHTLHGQWTTSNRRLLGVVDERVHLVAISRAQRAGNPALRYAGVVHNGIDLASHPFQPAKEDFVVFVGRVSAEKRPEVAIEVARRAGLPLVMIVKRNEPAERSYWDEIVAPRLTDNVTVIFEPHHELKTELMGKARALVFPIDWPEPFGLVMVESMACGTPVIACPVGAAPEVVDDGRTGFLRADIDEMAEAVESARRIKPTDCRAWVEQNFSAESMVSGYERIYRSAVAVAGAPARWRREVQPAS